MSETEAAKIETTETDSGTRKFFLKLGGILAIVLHPVFLFFYCFIVTYCTARYKLPIDIYFFEVFIIVTGLTIILPAVFSLLYAKDIFLKDLKKRPFIMIFTVLCYVTCFLFLRFFLGENPTFKNWHEIFSSSLLFLAMLIIGISFICYVTFWFKISLHANGLGFILAWIAVISLDPEIDINTRLLVFFIAIMPCGLLLWQRVESGSHSKKEVIYGLIFGFVISFMTIWFLPDNAIWHRIEVW